MQVWKQGMQTSWYVSCHVIDACDMWKQHAHKTFHHDPLSQQKNLIHVAKQESNKKHVQVISVSDVYGWDNNCQEEKKINKKL